jgi:hypothetical protein
MNLGWIDFSQLGLDPIIIVAIVFLTTFIKSFDKGNKLKRFYAAIPFAASMAIVALTIKWELKAWIIQSLVNAAIAAYLYNLYVGMIKPKRGK